MTSRVS